MLTLLEILSLNPEKRSQKIFNNYSCHCQQHRAFLLFTNTGNLTQLSTSKRATEKISQQIASAFLFLFQGQAIWLFVLMPDISLREVSDEAKSRVTGIL